MNYLNSLIYEASHVFSEAVAQTKNPVLLFSGGKDSIVMLHLAINTFYPASLPFSLLHIDTGHNFPEVLALRDKIVNKYGLELIVCKVEDTMSKKGIEDVKGKFPSRNTLQTYTLLDAIHEFKFDCCFGGARRDEEKARAKERIFSIRSLEGKWQPEYQRPELWNLYNGKLLPNQNMRVFPLSNFTELDIWNYIREYNIELPSIYYAHEREVLKFNGHLVAYNEFVNLDANDIVFKERVRYRTVGDMTCTAAIISNADTIDAVIAEIESTKLSERGETRMDDQTSDSAMENRKRKGYF